MTKNRPVLQFMTISNNAVSSSRTSYIIDSTSSHPTTSNPQNAMWTFATNERYSCYIRLTEERTCSFFISELAENLCNDCQVNLNCACFIIPFYYIC